jgi:hypothetical protein
MQCDCIHNSKKVGCRFKIALYALTGTVLMCPSDSYGILVSAMYRKKYGKTEMGSFNGLISNLIDVLIRSASDFAMALENRFYYLYISQNKT